MDNFAHTLIAIAAIWSVGVSVPSHAAKRDECTNSFGKLGENVSPQNNNSKALTPAQLAYVKGAESDAVHLLRDRLTLLRQGVRLLYGDADHGDGKLKTAAREELEFLRDEENLATWNGLGVPNGTDDIRVYHLRRADEVLGQQILALNHLINYESQALVPNMTSAQALHVADVLTVAGEAIPASQRETAAAQAKGLLESPALPPLQREFLTVYLARAQRANALSPTLPGYVESVKRLLQ